MRSACTVACWIDAMHFSRLTTTPLRRPSDGLSPTPRIITGDPGPATPSTPSDSAMTTATRDVPRSRPTVFFRRDKTVLERLLERRLGVTAWRVAGIISAPGQLEDLDFVGRRDLRSRPCG